MGEKITEQWLREIEQSHGHGAFHAIVRTSKLFDLTAEVRRLRGMELETVPPIKLRDATPEQLRVAFVTVRDRAEAGSEEIAALKLANALLEHHIKEAKNG